jgi:hypothetical protein
MTTPEETTKAIKEFAIKVRAALGDLTQEEIQDLTDGLEADLAERAAEQGIAFGSAAGYANELRAAAGIAGTAGSSVTPAASASATGNSAVVEFDSPIIDGSVKRKRVTLTQRLANWWQAKLDGNPLLGKTWNWLGNFRGFWWVLRGYAVFLVFANIYTQTGLLPASKQQFLFMLFCLASSYVLSMKFWGRNWFLQLVAFGGHLLTLFAMFSVIMGAYGWQDMQYASKYPNMYNVPEGIQYNGKTVENIFAFDQNGKRIPIVQLFDQTGEPIAVTRPGSTLKGLPVWWSSNRDGESITVTTGAYDELAPVWNAWPLLQTTQWNNSFTGHLPTTPLDSPVENVPKLTIIAKHLLPTPAASPSASGNPSANSTTSPTPSVSGK